MASLLQHTLNVFTCFDMYKEKRPIAILWYQLDVSEGLVFKFIGGSNHSLGKLCYK